MKKKNNSLTGLIAFRVLPDEKERIEIVIQNLKTTKSEFFRNNIHKLIKA